MRNHVLSKNSIILIAAGLLINLLLAKLVLALELPIFLDSVGTVLAAAVGGYLPGVIVGFGSNVINSIGDPVTLYYGIVSVLIAIVTSFLSERGVFRRLWSALLAGLAFALVGGGLGSLITWLLYGFDFGTGISAPFATLLNESAGLPPFSAQLVADMGIDVADKLVTVLLVFLALRLAPERLLARLPLGWAYSRNEEEFARRKYDSVKRAAAELRFSLRNKMALILITTVLALSIVAVSIGFSLYVSTMDERYVKYGQTATELAKKSIDANMVDYWLANGENSTGYEETENKLYEIRRAMDEIEYIYVYKILEDGCHVVFDLTTADLPGAEAGSVVAFDESFKKYLPQLLAGEEIEPVVSNETYGWLLTVYAPLIDSAGNCVAYVATDIEMEEVISDRMEYIIRMVALLFGLSAIITAFVLQFVRQNMVRPLNELSEAANKFAYDSEHDRKKNIERIERLSIRTGDEIEYLYSAIVKTTKDFSSYIEQLDEKSEELIKQAFIISKLQDNMIISFATMVENRDENTGSHIKRTAAYVRIVANALAKNEKYAALLTPEYIEKLVKSAPLHDIGKIRIPDAILNKPGKLTPEEFEIIKSHTTAGYEILQDVLKGIDGENMLSEAMDMAYAHHEWWNGIGYPRGLAGEQIPLSARLMAIADVFDALVSKRSYKEPFPFEQAVGIIVSESGTHFDPEVVAAFTSAAEELRGWEE